MISKEDLLGSWHLESWTMGYSNRDDFSYPFGEEPHGLLLYTDDGWMSASISRKERAAFPEDVPFRKIPEADKAEAFSSYFHYAGRYRVVDGDVIHYVSQSLNPNFPGTIAFSLSTRRHLRGRNITTRAGQYNHPHPPAYGGYRIRGSKR